MSLGFALSMTARGLQATENRMTVAAGNITNADKPGYTRKVVTERYITSNAGTVPIYGTVSGTVDRYLTKQVVRDTTDLGYKNVLASYLDLYQKQMGSTDGATTLSGYLNSLYSNLQITATSPETSANKAYVVSIAQNMANSLRNLSMDVQAQRLQADKKIEEVVGTINTSLEKIHELNNQISGTQEAGAARAEYEDQRLYELEKLGENMDIQYFFDNQDRVQIYTASGQALLLSSPHLIDYTASTSIDSTSLYPAAFAAIDLDGVDLTPLLNTGMLGGLVNLRDGIFVDEQAKLDEFATTLQFEMNAVLNTGTSLPPQPTMTGSLSGLTGATAFAGLGIVRVGVVDNDGITINYTDVNLAALPTVGAVVGALNGIANINASIDPSGRLVISSTLANSGVAINTMTSDVGALNQGFSHFFGLNDLFTGTGAQTMDVAAYLQSDTDFLAAGVFSGSATLAAGDRGVPRGDGSVVDAMADLLVSNVNFGAAGNFSAQSNTLKSYGEAIMANAASQAQIAQDEADTAQVVFQQTKDILSNKSGVNIDEETAKMVELQTKYQASASVIATIKTMFQALLDAVR